MRTDWWQAIHKHTLGQNGISFVSSLFPLDNEKNFIGCLSPSEEATPLTVTFNSNGMTPRKCKIFCQQHGHSVALLKQGAQCFCSEYSHIVSWRKNKFSCPIPCTGEEKMFCGGKEAYSSYRIIPGNFVLGMFLLFFCLCVVPTLLLWSRSCCRCYFCC